MNATVSANTSHNVQPLQGVVLKQRFCNRNEAVAADVIVLLQKYKNDSDIKHSCNIKKLSPTHYAKRLHGAVGSHGLCNKTSAVCSDVIVALQKNCGSVEFRK